MPPDNMIQMKNLLIILIACIFFVGCTNKKPNTKATLDSVLDIHEKLMAADGQLMTNKAALDTFVKTQNLTVKDTAFILSKQAAAADSIMYNWMNNFKAEYKGKTDSETMAYFNAQKKLIIELDVQLNHAVTSTGKYLLKIKKK